MIESADMEVDESPALTTEAANAEEEDDSSSIPEGEYEIEAILSHEVGRFSDKKKANDIAYLVSWKGYGEEHNSWVEEKDAENASEMIEAYWATASKVGVARKQDGTGWTGIKSAKTRRAIKMESPDGASASTSVARGKRTGRTVAQEEEDANKRRKNAIHGSYTRSGIEITDVTDIEEEAEVSEKQLKRLKPDEQARVKRRSDGCRYLAMPDWEQVVKYVETVERDQNGKLITFIIFENGDRYAFESAVVNHRCPQKVITFYESRLRFRPQAADLPPLTSASSVANVSAVQDSSTRGGEDDTVVADEGIVAEKDKGEQPMPTEDVSTDVSAPAAPEEEGIITSVIQKITTVEKNGAENTIGEERLAAGETTLVNSGSETTVSSEQ